MITINAYTSTKMELCQDCAASEPQDMLAPNQSYGLDSDPDTGEIFEPHFGKFPCDLCGDRLAGHRFGATLLTKTTTVKGEL